MAKNSSLPISTPLSLPYGAWKRLLTSWLLTIAILLCAGMLIVAVNGRLYLWWWAGYVPSHRDEFGPENLAPDFTLRDLEGRPFHLAEEVRKSPVILEIGSFT